MRWPGLTPKEPRSNEAMRPTAVADHDINDLKMGPSATEWRHATRCPHCLEHIGRNEYSTKICMTCGQSWEWMSDAKIGAIRKIRRGGQWIPDLLINKRHYTFDGKDWILLLSTKDSAQ